ncbi:hypothetical protein JCM11641_001287 [Rhodosporidiobolus odoratus]
MARGKSSRASALKANRALKEVDDNSDSDFDPDVEEVHEEPVSAQEEEEEEYVRPVKKKARTSRGGGGSTKKGTKGSLKGILDLPLDILTEICAELDLPTVFHLSRLNKRFYAFLRDPSLKYIWDVARESSGLPDLTSPGCDVYGYANLLFGGFCKGCGKATAKVDYILRIRTCKKCTPDFIEDPRGSEYDTELDYAIGSYRQGTNYRSHDEYLLEDLRNIRRLIDRYVRLSKKYNARNCEEPDDETEDQDEELVGEASYAGYTRIGDPDAFTAFTARCAELASQRIKDGEAIIGWMHSRELEKEAALQAIRDERRKAIEVRLTDRGWKPHHFKNPAFSEHKLVNTAKAFDQHVWEAAQAPLEEVLREILTNADAAYIKKESTRRENVLRAEYLKISTDVARQKTSGFFPFPLWGDFRKIPTVKQLYQLTSIEQAYTEGKTLDDVKRDIAVDLAAARKGQQRDIVERLVLAYQTADQRRSAAAASTAASSTSVPNPSASVASDTSHTPANLPSPLLPALADGISCTPSVTESILARATSLVTCYRCDQLDNFPRILAHKCDHIASWQLSHIEVEYDVDTNVVGTALKLLDVLGKDLDTLAQEVEQLGRVFSCISPDCSGYEAIALPWHLIVDHATKYHTAYDDDPGEFVLETEEQAMRRVFNLHIEKERYHGSRGETFSPSEDQGHTADEGTEENASKAGEGEADGAGEARAV